MNGLCLLLFSSKLRRGDMERPVAPQAHGHAANQSGPKTYSKVNGSHACGGVCQHRRPVRGSWVRVFRGPEFTDMHFIVGGLRPQQLSKTVNWQFALVPAELDRMPRHLENK